MFVNFFSLLHFIITVGHLYLSSLISFGFFCLVPITVSYLIYLILLYVTKHLIDCKCSALVGLLLTLPIVTYKLVISLKTPTGFI